MKKTIPTMTIDEARFEALLIFYAPRTDEFSKSQYAMLIIIKELSEKLKEIKK